MDIATLLFDMLTLVPGSEQDRADFAVSFMYPFLSGYKCEKDISPFWVQQLPRFLKLLELNYYVVMKKYFPEGNWGWWGDLFMPGRRDRIVNGVLFVDMDFTDIQRQALIVDYDPQWATDFHELVGVVNDALGDLIVGIEHVGSTSVPRLAAKPVIDLDVVIPSLEVFPRVVAALAKLGYEHIGDRGIEGREVFQRDSMEIPRAPGASRSHWPLHHFYVCVEGSPELGRHLAFRDYLRAHPEIAGTYGKHKRELAEAYKFDLVSYTEAKSEFIGEVLAKVDRGAGSH